MAELVIWCEGSRDKPHPRTPVDLGGAGTKVLDFADADQRALTDPDAWKLATARWEATQLECGAPLADGTPCAIRLRVEDETFTLACRTLAEPMGTGDISLAGFRDFYNDVAARVSPPVTD